MHEGLTWVDEVDRRGWSEGTVCSTCDPYQEIACVLEAKTLLLRVDDLLSPRPTLISVVRDAVELFMVKNRVSGVLER